jgi:signal transduction histidine kinase/CheY-like chemotaxis protein
MIGSRTTVELARVLLLAAVYFAAAKLGLSLAHVHASATAVWAPTGIAFAALLVLGPRLWPGVFLGAFLANITTQGSVLTVAGIAAGNTLEAVLGASLVQRYADGPDAFLHPRGVLLFTLLAGLLSTTVSATFGVTSLSLGGNARWPEYGSIWWTWWLGDVMGNLIVAASLVLWMQDPRIRYTRAQALELGLWLLLALLIGQVVFGPWLGIGAQGLPLEFLFLPLLLWMAFRFSPRETATGALVLAGLVLWGTLQGYGPFARAAPNTGLLLLQAFMGTTAVTAIGLAAAILERKRAQEALRQSEELLRQSQKMEAIGRLSGGIAHDFNNILSAILGFTELMLQDTAKSDLRRQQIEEIRRSAQRAAGLTHQLLAFGRKQVLRPSVLCLNGVVTHLQEMLRRLIGEHIELVPNLDPGLGNVKIDRNQFEQVIVNLALHARDAMPNGGRLTIETRNVELEAGQAKRAAELPTGRCVMLRIGDTGAGLDARTLEHLFEPFFTTQDRSQGMGLGLAAVYGIVRQSNGQIRVDSQPGAGTTFTIHLPRVDEEPAAEAPPLRASDSAHAAGTILVAEDEDAVRRMICTVLERCGYTVLEARDGMEALQVCARREQPLDLLLTDMVMPHINGRQLAEQVVRIRPGLRILFMSGYADEAVLQGGELEPGRAFMAKPLVLNELTRRVKEILAAPAPGIASSG